MKISKSIKISLRIIYLFVVAMLLSFIPEYYHELFGDWHCKGSGTFTRIPDTYMGKYEFCNYSNCSIHDAVWHWGYRHWLFLLMGISLAIIQIVDIIQQINKDSY